MNGQSLSRCIGPFVLFWMLYASPVLAQQSSASQCAPTIQNAAPPNSARGDTSSLRAALALDVLAAANTAARERPQTEGFVRARQVYDYAAGSIYELYANPNFVSTILLEPGETLNSIAAGDTSRWMVSEASAESATEPRTLVLVKPQAAPLRTNIVLVTDRRTYVIEAIAHAGAAYSAEIAWCYPAEAPRQTQLAPTFDLPNFAYRVHTVRGRRPAWIPVRVFDDGRRTWIEWPANVGAGDMPPLFVITPEGAELVNYRIQGQYYLVDRLFDVAELRLGARAPIVVRIERRAALRASSVSLPHASPRSFLGRVQSP